MPTRFLPFWCLSALTLLLALAPTSRAEVTLELLNPDAGTVGGLFELRLEGDLGNGKPKIWLTRSDDTSNKPKKTKFKVFSVASLGGELSSLLVRFTKTKTGPGLYDLHVKPKGKGQVEQVFDEVFSMQAPVLAAVDPGTAASKAQVMLSGMFFGNPKKPVVRVSPVGGGKSKKVKVLSVSLDTMAQVKLPKLAPGSYDVSLANMVGESVLAAGLTITGVGGPGPGNYTDFVRATLAADDDTLLTTQFNAEGPGKPLNNVQGLNASNEVINYLAINAGTTVGIEAVAIAIVVPFNPGVTPTPFTIDFSTPAGFGVGLTQTSPHAGWDSAGPMKGSLTITAATATRVEGSFEFVLGPAVAAPNPASGELQVRNGTFSVPVLTL